MEADPPKSDDKEKPRRTSEEKKKPLFEAPLLSHDVFANLPLPSKGRSRERLSDTASVADAASRTGRDVAEEMGIKAEQADAVTEIQDEEVAVREAVSHVGETITDVLRSAPGPLPSIAPTRAAPNDDPHRSTGSSSPLQPPPRNARDSDRKPELLKSTVIGLVDTTIVEHGLSGDHDETNALDREEFVRQMFDVLKVSLFLWCLRERMLIPGTRASSLAETKCADPALRKVSRAGRRVTVNTNRTTSLCSFPSCSLPMYSAVESGDR